MPIKTQTFVFFILKTYFAVAFAYFLILLFQADKALGQFSSIDLPPLAIQALIWPKDVVNYLWGVKR